MKWYVTVETQVDGKNYAGICEYYGGEESQEGFISLHNSETDADAACVAYAQDNGIPTFADYQYPYKSVDACFACPKCGNRDMDTLLLDHQDMAHCQNCGTVYDPQKAE